MSDINDFKLVNSRSKALFESLGIANNLTDIKKSRLGFYHLVLENITGILDNDSISNLIIDSDYNSVMFNKKIEDLGIDAVYIDDESDTVKISLFNFKFREKFSDHTMEENALSRSTKFLEYIVDNNDKYKEQQLGSKVSDKITQIRNYLFGNKICDMKLYMVSNESHGYNSNVNPYISILEEKYEMQIRTITLGDIVGFIAQSRFDKECRLILEPTSFLSFLNDEESTQKSYVVCLSIIDLIRITNINSEICVNTSMDDDSFVLDCKLDYSLLFDNVRGFLGATSYNAGIQNTINENPSYFFMYNNGLTFTAECIECKKINSGKKYSFLIQNYQIVNGGQTMRAIYDFLEKNREEDDIEKLRNASVLVRFLKVSSDDCNDLKNRIAEYTNSQNKISDSDLKSVDHIQIQIEKYLQDYKILYKRKAGDVGNETITYSHVISKERLAQILYSSYGFPNKASNQKKKLFNDFYEEVFKSSKFSLENIPDLCELFFSIQSLYKEKNLKYYDLKSFYVIYICKNYDKEPNEAIDVIEQIIQKELNSSGKIITESRLLLQSKIKTLIDDFLINEKCLEKARTKHC